MLEAFHSAFINRSSETVFKAEVNFLSFLPIASKSQNDGCMPSYAMLDFFFSQRYGGDVGTIIIISA